MAIPIILIHRSNSNYLPYTIAQAKWANPQSRLFLIGDQSNRYELVEHEFISNYMDSATKFAHVYQHLSTNPIGYELFCFQRWFILKDFMSRHALEQCFYLDSDVMLYEDITLDQQRWKQYEIALTAHVPSSTFVNDFSSLERFCDFVFNLYQNADSFQKIELAFKEQLQNALATSISDMFAFAEYRKQYPDQVGDLLEVIDDSIYDAGMTASYGFQTVNGVKSIHFRNKQPFGQELESGRSIRFKALHFQGSSKRYIKDYFTGDRLPDRISNESLTAFSSQLKNQPESRVSPYAVVQAQPDNAEAHHALGCELLEQGQPSDAARCFQTAIRLLPTFFNAYIDLGVALIQQNQAEEAMRCYQTALELQPNSALAYGNLGYVYGEIGQIQASVSHTAMCNALETLALKPDWAEAHRNLGLAYQQLGNLKDAIVFLRQALDLQPDFLAAQVDLQNALLQQQFQQQVTSHLRAVNLIIFPDWQQALDSLYLDLEIALKAVLTHSQHSKFALLVYVGNLTEACDIDVETALNEVIFNLLMTQAIDVDEASEVCPFSRLSTAQWDTLLPQVSAWIRLKHEDLTAVPETIRQGLVSLELDAQGNLHL